MFLFADTIESEIEYFPISPTLTRIRVHKQNITSLSECPFYLNLLPYQETTLSYPSVPFGVCSSFSQIQIFPQTFPFHYYIPPYQPETPEQTPNKGESETLSENTDKLEPETPVQELLIPKTEETSKKQKFSVHLQNISGPDEYIQIIPKPRNLSKKSHIYANLPFKKEPKKKLSLVQEENIETLEDSVETNTEEKNNIFKEVISTVGCSTSSDSKEIVPALTFNSVLEDNKKSKRTQNSDALKKINSKRSSLSGPKFSLVSKKPSIISQSKQSILKEKLPKKVSANKLIDLKDKKVKKNGKSSKVPLSESILREKPLSKTSKRLKTLTESFKKKKILKKSKTPVEKDQSSEGEDNLESVAKCLKSDLPSTYVDLKIPDYLSPTFFVEESEEDENLVMDTVSEIMDQFCKGKPKVDSNMTEVFRSRSFSPDVRRKVYKLPDMNKPLPPIRQESRHSPTLKMWSNVLVSYPGHVSRLDEYDSNVKFLQDKIQRKLTDDKEMLMDDVETVRTVKKDKNGTMSIKTNRYVRVSRPSSTRYNQVEVEPQEVISYPDKKVGSTESLQYSKSSLTSKKKTESNVKKDPLRKKEVDASSSYTVHKSANKEDKKRSLKVTVAVSSKAKESSKKGSVPVPKQSPSSVKKPESPCPSISSYRSGLSVKSPQSDKCSISSQERMRSPSTRIVSSNSSISRLSSSSRSVSPGVMKSKLKEQKLNSEVRLTSKKSSSILSARKLEAKASTSQPHISKSDTKTSRITNFTKTPEKRLLATSNIVKTSSSKEQLKKKTVRKNVTANLVESCKVKKVVSEKPETILIKKTEKVEREEPKNEAVLTRDLVRTDSFFQNLFLRGSAESDWDRTFVDIERLPSVLERARRFQNKINWPQVYKSEPSLPVVTFYLNQKRPVSFSKLRYLDRDWSSSRSQSPLGSFHSENFQSRLKRFDSMSQVEYDSNLENVPQYKIRSSSEPPHSSQVVSFDDRKYSRTSASELSSMRSSPTSSRSPSYRRIKAYKPSIRVAGSSPTLKLRDKSPDDIEKSESKSNFQYSELAKSTSSLNLSNASDHTEYQAYILELMHSTPKCERFRELHKFYSNLERIGNLEKTASTGDLRPRLKNEEIIDFDRWKRIRTKERAEAELKALVDNLVKVQKEKNLLFRAADIDAVRWKGDRGLRMKDKSVGDLKQQFNKYSQEELNSQKNESEVVKDSYRSLWKGNSIIDVASNLNNPLVSYRGRPITVEDYEKIEKLNSRIGKKYGYCHKAWSSLSNEQIDILKDQLSEIYSQEIRRRERSGSLEELSEKYEIFVPKDTEVKSPGESSLKVRCSSAMSKSQTFTPTVKRKEEMRKEWKKAESISTLPTWKPKEVNLPQLIWKEDTKMVRSHSESRKTTDVRSPILRTKSTSSKPLSESEKKQLSMTLSKEVREKMKKGPGKGLLLPRETLGAIAVAESNKKEAISSHDNNINDDISMTLTFNEAQAAEELIEKYGTDKHLIAPPLKLVKTLSTTELESGSGSSETSVKTVIRKNLTDVSKKVQYFEDLQQSNENCLESELKESSKDEFNKVEEKIETVVEIQDSKNSRTNNKGDIQIEKKKKMLISSSSLENLNDYFGQQKQYTITSLSNRPKVAELPKNMIPLPPKREDFVDTLIPPRYHSTSPTSFRRAPTPGSNESLFSYRSRSVSPDPTKYYRAYLSMVKSGAVRKLCNKFESWEDLMYLSSDKDFWLPPAPRRFASDPELTRDMLKRFGTNPTKVTVRGQEVGDVRWLRTKFEKDLPWKRSQNHFRRATSPLVRSPISLSDRFMPRINVISKKAELQLQHRKTNEMSPTRLDLVVSPEGYRSLLEYTRDNGAYCYTGEVEKLRRKFERLQEAERLSIMGQMYTSAPDFSELRDIAPYLECSWVAHRYPGSSKRLPSPDVPVKRREVAKPTQLKPRPRSSSPIRPKQPSSILKQPYSSSDRGIFADQKFDPSIHRPKYRYQPEHEADRLCKRGDQDWWRHWNKPTVTFKGFFLGCIYTVKGGSLLNITK